MIQRGTPVDERETNKVSVVPIVSTRTPFIRTGSITISSGRKSFGKDGDETVHHTAARRNGSSSC